ncbi:MAG: NUDIX hydrolase [Leptospiraceae bacterium]|nr:NUDIX hydrolase [Leptospiraceae bacterium]
MPKPVTPLVTADAIIEHRGGIILIERLHEPFGHAIPGGFVDVGETMEHAARREALEETGLQVELIDLLAIYSDPARDKRGHNATAVYIARAEDAEQAQAGDDAGAIYYWRPGEPTPEMAFDHALILQDYLEYKSSGRRPAPMDLLARSYD